MILLVGVLVLSSVPYFVLSDAVSESLVEPCEIHDIECLSRSTEKNLERTSKGIPQYDIKPIDPLIITKPIAHVHELLFRYENINVTGLRNQKISDFQMDTKAKLVILKMKADLNIVSDITVVLDDTKSLSGVYHGSASIIATARYNYDLIKDDIGVEYFVVGPETLTCEVPEDPIAFMNKELVDDLAKEPVAEALKPAYKIRGVEYRKHTVSRIAEEAFADVIQNIRAAAKILPKSAFFKNM